MSDELKLVEIPSTPLVKRGIIARAATVPVEVMPVAMDRSEAVACLEEVRGHLRDAKWRLLEFYERDGWQALGYASFKECAAAELNASASSNYCYDVLSAARVERNLRAAMPEVVAHYQLPVSQALVLAPLEPEQQVAAYDLARRVAGVGKLTERLVLQAARDVAPGALRAGLKRGRDNPNPSQERYTPKRLVDLYVRVLGEIDLDPCCNPGEPNVPARNHFRREDDGLSHDWGGKIYGNFPYNDPGGPRLLQWVRHLQLQRDVTEWICLVPAYTDTIWWHELCKDFPLICLHRGRIHFLDEQMEPQTDTPFPSASIYQGPNPEVFYDALFSEGLMVQQVNEELITR